MSTLKVVSPLVIARDDEGRFVYLYQGSVVPAHVAADDLARLQEEGHVVALTLAAPTLPEAAKLPHPGRVEPAKK